MSGRVPDRERQSTCSEDVAVVKRPQVRGQRFADPGQMHFKMVYPTASVHIQAMDIYRYPCLPLQGRRCQDMVKMGVGEHNKSRDQTPFAQGRQNDVGFAAGVDENSLPGFVPNDVAVGRQRPDREG